MGYSWPSNLEITSNNKFMTWEAHLVQVKCGYFTSPTS